MNNWLKRRRQQKKVEAENSTQHALAMQYAINVRTRARLLLLERRLAQLEGILRQDTPTHGCGGDCKCKPTNNFRAPEV